MEGDYYVAWRSAQPVGTIAAFINHRHNEFHNERIGWFGAFDVLDDQEARDRPAGYRRRAGAAPGLRGIAVARRPSPRTRSAAC